MKEKYIEQRYAFRHKNPTLKVLGLGRILGVSNVTVLKWIRTMGEKLFETGALWKKTDIKSVSQIQIDEFWHYVKKNEISYGYGLLYGAKQNKFLPFFVVNGLKDQLDIAGH